MQTIQALSAPEVSTPAPTLEALREIERKLSETNTLVHEQEEQYEQLQKEVLRALNGHATPKKWILKCAITMGDVLMHLITCGIVVWAFVLLVTAFPIGVKTPEAGLGVLAFIAGTFALMQVNEKIRVRIISPFRVRHGIGNLEDYERTATSA